VLWRRKPSVRRRSCLSRTSNEALEAVGQMGSAGREHFYEVLGTAWGLVGIEEDGPALMHDEIEFSVVEAEFASPLAHFVRNRDRLASDRFGCLDEAVGRYVARATLALSAKHPESHSEAVGFSFRNEFFYDQIIVL
jgi:hypothetical protein